MLRAGGESGSDRCGFELLLKMMPGAAIRRGHSADPSAVSQLLESAGLPTADLTSAHEFQSRVLEEKGSIVGLIGLERFGREALLRSLAVAPTHRKRGSAPGERRGKTSAEFRILCPVSVICMSKALRDG